MKIVVTTIDEKEYTLKTILQVVFSETAGVACNSLSVKFMSDFSIGEIVSVKAYNNDKLVFNGYCDNQKISVDETGFEIYFYARSTACLLVDSQSQPFTYNKPTARQLYVNYARELGFKYALPDIGSEEKYEVSIGTSCFGAINNFVSLLSGEEIYINPENEIKLLCESEKIVSLNKYNVLSATSVINRSEPLSLINYKRELSDEYKVHMKSLFAENLKIKREKYINLTSLPTWQREYTIMQKLKNSFEEYKVLEVTVVGYCNEEIYQRFNYKGKIGECVDYLLFDKKYSYDKNGERTKLILKKRIDIGDVTYVA